jgi:hypothetical protein
MSTQISKQFVNSKQFDQEIETESEKFQRVEAETPNCNSLRESEKFIPFMSVVDYNNPPPFTFSSSASSVFGDHHAYNALFAGTGPYFQSQSIPGSWWAVKFSTEVVLSAYRIRCEPRWPAPRGWDLELSMDGIGWVVVDRRRDVGDDGYDRFMGLISERECRHARIRMVGKNSFGKDSLMIQEINFMGKARTK